MPPTYKCKECEKVFVGWAKEPKKCDEVIGCDGEVCGGELEEVDAQDERNKGFVHCGRY